MSHAEIIQKNYDVLLRCTTVNYYVIDFLKSENVLDRMQEAELKETKNSVKQRILLFQWLQELPSEKYDTFLQVMNDTEQQHVTNLLRGRTEEGLLPLLNTRHDRLEKNRHRIADVVRTDSELVAELRKSTAISRIDADEIRAAEGEYKKSSKLISSIMRRSNQCYSNFQDALRKTLQTTAAEFVNEGEMPAVHLNNNRPDLDESLSFSLNEAIRNNPVCDTRIKELITELNQYGLTLAAAIPGQSIVIFIYCKTVQSAVKFTQLFNSGMLQYLLDSILSRLLLTIEPQNTKELNSLISLEDEEIATLEEFTGMEGWKTQRLGGLQFFRKKSERDATTQADDNVIKRKITEEFDLELEIAKIPREIFELEKKSKEQHAGFSAAPKKYPEERTLQIQRREFPWFRNLLQEERARKRAQRKSIRVNSASSYGRDAKYPRREESGSAPSYQDQSSLDQLSGDELSVDELSVDQLSWNPPHLPLIRLSSGSFSEALTSPGSSTQESPSAERKHQKSLLPRQEYHRTQNLNQLPVKCLHTIFLKTSALQKGHREAQHQNLASVCTMWRNIVAVMHFTFRHARLIRVVLPVKFRSHPVLVQTIRTKDAEERNKTICGLTILDKELFVVSETSSEVEVYDAVRFIFSRQLTLRKLIHPQDICSCSRNQCLYIVQLKEILRVDPRGTIIKNWSTGEDLGWGLSVTDESNVILAVYNKHKLSEYSPDGQLIREINLSSDGGIRCPRHAIKLINGHFVVSHGFGYIDPHKVIIVDSNGKLQKSFGATQESTIVQLNSPVYLSVDENGYVLVVDRGNSRVLLLDPELKYRKEFLSKEKHGLLFPQRILLNESNGQLFVADNDGKDGRILIFQLKTSTVTEFIKQ